MDGCHAAGASWALGVEKDSLSLVDRFPLCFYPVLKFVPYWSPSCVNRVIHLLFETSAEVCWLLRTLPSTFLAHLLSSSCAINQLRCLTLASRKEVL